MREGGRGLRYGEKRRSRSALSGGISVVRNGTAMPDALAHIATPRCGEPRWLRARYTMRGGDARCAMGGTRTFGGKWGKEEDENGAKAEEEHR